MNSSTNCVSGLRPPSDGYVVIKFRNTNPEKIDFPIGAKGNIAPNTRIGMLGNDSRIIFEYKINGRDLEEGDYFEYFNEKGKFKATYDYINSGVWKKRK